MTTTGALLIIDDEPGLRQTFARILRQAGCEVITAGSGPEALEHLAAAPVDLVYLDVHLPGLSGLQVLERIHRRWPELPVILFTGHATVQTAAEAVRLGAVDYLIKPIDPDTLVARTRVVLAEQTGQRRRREILAQIEALQAELRALGGPSPAPYAPPAAEAAPAGRFVKRGPLIVDLQAQRATLGDRILDLPPAAFDYLAVLARHSPGVVDYQTLVAEAQGYQTDRREAQDLSKWHIHTLREALEQDPRQPRFILNVRGSGYRLLMD